MGNTKVPASKITYYMLAIAMSLIVLRNCVVYSLQVHYNSNDDKVTGSNSLSTTEYKVIPTLSLPESKENNQLAADNSTSQVLPRQDEGKIRKQENNMSVPPIRTTLLRERII